MKNPILSITILLLILLGSNVGAFFAGKGNKKVEIQTVEVVTEVPVPYDTCFKKTIDSMEIYRAVRKGLAKKYPPTDVVSTVKEDTTVTVISHADSLLTLSVSVKHTGEVLDTPQFEIKLDTPVIVQNQIITQEVPVTVERIVEKQVIIEQPYSPKQLCYEIAAGTRINDWTNFVVQGKLYYVNRKFWQYGASINTRKDVMLHFGMPIFKGK